MKMAPTRRGPYAAENPHVPAPAGARILTRLSEPAAGLIDAVFAHQGWPVNQATVLEWESGWLDAIDQEHPTPWPLYRDASPTLLNAVYRTAWKTARALVG